ncbi:MAG: hypothetical protein R3E12_12575 [Candidatus Eisenbacteria bacterium]|uniref:Uncharacterized protein n=1 Tax=Eiseniibacteriota bacterium TaxID=2212470 RepID=A0A956LVA4_UNCEI|nr:hypothetical protein [Candidatus Eisenbacteria bacterium]
MPSSLDEGGSSPTSVNESEAHASLPAFGEGPATSSFRPFWALLLFGLAVLPYVKAMQNDFVFDSRFLVGMDPRVQDLSRIPAIFTTEYWNVPDLPSRLYRPITTLSYAAVSALAGNTPAAQHLTNVLFHGIDVVLLYALVLALGGRAGAPPRRAQFAALVTAALAAVHPVRSEAVLDVVGRGELLAFGFGITALLGALRGGARGLALAAFAAALSVLCKESGIVIPVFGAVLLLASEGRLDRTVLGRTGGLVAGVIGALILRSFVLADIAEPTIEFGDNALAVVGLPARVWTGAVIAGKYLLLNVWPRTLSADYSYNAIPVRMSPDPATVVGFLALAILAGVWIVSVRRGPMLRVLGAGAGCLLLGLIAIDNQIVLIGTMLGERLTYLATCGFFLMCGVVAAWALESRRILALGIIVVLVGGSALRTWARVPEWKTQRTLFESATRAQPESFRVWTGLGEALIREQRLAESIPCFERSAAIHPGYGTNWSLWLSALVDLGQWDDVPGVLAGLRNARPDDRIGYYAAARLAQRTGDLDDAEREAREGRLRYPEDPLLVRAAAEISVASGRDTEGLALYQSLLESGQGTEADQLKTAFLQVKLEHWEAAEAEYAALFARRGDWYTANALAWSKRGRALELGGDPRVEPLLTEARALAQQAVDLAGENDRRFALDTQAKIEESLGNAEAALAIYRDLYTTYPDQENYRAERDRLLRAVEAR